MKVFSLLKRVALAPFKLVIVIIIFVICIMPCMLFIFIAVLCCENDVANDVMDFIDNRLGGMAKRVMKFGCPYKE